jgi:hypothetical protein
MAAHESPRTPKLYDRTKERLNHSDNHWLRVANDQPETRAFVARRPGLLALGRLSQSVGQ